MAITHSSGCQDMYLSLSTSGLNASGKRNRQHLTSYFRAYSVMLSWASLIPLLPFSPIAVRGYRCVWGHQIVDGPAPENALQTVGYVNNSGVGQCTTSSALHGTTGEQLMTWHSGTSYKTLFVILNFFLPNVSLVPFHTEHSWVLENIQPCGK